MMRSSAGSRGNVSVPLRGFCFSTGIELREYPAIWIRFRPLTGILFFNGTEKKNRIKRGRGFRPLTGILFFNKHGTRRNAAEGIAVSVPLRGFCFSTLTTSYSKGKVFRFRPLTGILFFNGRNESLYVQGRAAFPSPYGDFVFQQLSLRYGNGKETVSVSVPLRGFCFSTVPPKSLVIPDLSKPFAERRLKFLFQSAADDSKMASALI